MTYVRTETLVEVLRRYPGDIDYPRVTMYEALMQTVSRSPDAIAYDFFGYDRDLPAVRRRDRPLRRCPGRPRPEEGRPDHDLHAHLPPGDHLLLRREQAGRRGEHDPSAVARQGDRVLPEYRQEPLRADAGRLLRKIQGGRRRKRTSRR